jgi:hypothetical protein
MIVDTAAGFRRALESGPLSTDAPATAAGALLVEPESFRLSTETAGDNTYMNLARQADAERAMAQHRALAHAIRAHARLPLRVFPGDPRTPDAEFPNNVYGFVPGKLVVGAMRHPERRLESHRSDILEAMAADGRAIERLDVDPAVVSELTGPVVIDRARGIGYHGLTERLNVAGARATHAAFGLRLSLLFQLAPGEYHTNVVMAVLAGRALVLHRESIVDEGVADAIAEVYAPHVIWLDDEEKAAFVGNCISLTPDQVWMSATAERGLSHGNRQRLRDAGFTVHTVEIDEIEKAGGSLRCCIAEIF